MSEKRRKVRVEFVPRGVWYDGGLGEVDIEFSTSEFPSASAKVSITLHMDEGMFSEAIATLLEAKTVLENARNRL